MPTMQIAKPQTGELPKVKSPNMNDRDRLNDILAQQKYLINGFTTGLNEMQNPRLRDMVAEVLRAQQDLQWQLFNAMFEKGWYKMKAADAQEVFETHKQFANYASQFPSFT